MDKMWKNYRKGTEQCYDYMIGAGTDYDIWEKTFRILVENIREYQKNHREFKGSILELEDELEYDCDITGWLEDYLDEMEMHHHYDAVIDSCTELLSLFKMDSEELSDYRFRISSALMEQNKVNEAEEYCKNWYSENQENVVAATALVYAEMAKKDYELAERIIDQFDLYSADEDKEILVNAAERLYAQTKNIVKQKEMQKLLDEYEAEMLRMFDLDDMSEDDEDSFWDEEDLPFN